MSQGRFNVNKLEEIDGAQTDLVYLVLQRDVPKRYSPPASSGVPVTYETVYERGVTMKADNTPLDINGGADAFTLPSDWRTKEQMILGALSSFTFGGTLYYTLGTRTHDIRALTTMAVNNATYTLTGDVQASFNPTTGVFNASADNRNIDFIILVG